MAWSTQAVGLSPSGASFSGGAGGLPAPPAPPLLQSGMDLLLQDQPDYPGSVVAQVDANLSAPHAAGGTSGDAGAGGGRSLEEIISIGCVLSVLDITTVLGNLLVCVTILVQRRLRNSTNYFIFSLALSDLLLGILVLPFSTINTLVTAWPLGSTFCNIFISTDVMLCTVSILNLFAISLERYFAVSNPLHYSQFMTFRVVMVIVGSIWIFSFIMAFVPIHLGWNTVDGNLQNVKQPEMCLFESNIVYVLLVSVGTYFVPLVVMCVVYVKVFMIARDQVQRINQLVKQTISVFHKQDNDPRLASDSKATVTLASVVTAFAICWIPYFVIFTARPFLASGVDPNLDLFALWLGYINSMLNPFLYAFHSNSFRRGFVSVLTRKPMRDEFDPGQYV